MSPAGFNQTRQDRMGRAKFPASCASRRHRSVLPVASRSGDAGSMPRTEGCRRRRHPGRRHFRRCARAGPPGTRSAPATLTQRDWSRWNGTHLGRTGHESTGDSIRACVTWELVVAKAKRVDLPSRPTEPFRSAPADGWPCRRLGPPAAARRLRSSMRGAPPDPVSPHLRRCRHVGGSQPGSARAGAGVSCSRFARPPAAWMPALLTGYRFRADCSSWRARRH